MRSEVGNHYKSQVMADRQRLHLSKLFHLGSVLLTSIAPRIFPVLVLIWIRKLLGPKRIFFVPREIESRIDFFRRGRGSGFDRAGAGESRGVDTYLAV